MKICNISESYIQFLKTYDSKVPNNYNESRPFVGIVLTVDSINYYVPLTSPKNKHKSMHDTKDFMKINNGSLGAINFNNMIPVSERQIIDFNISDLVNERYKNILYDQAKYIRRHSSQIQETAKELRNLIYTEDSLLTNNDIRIKQRCCNLVLLDSIYTSYSGI